MPQPRNSSGDLGIDIVAARLGEEALHNFFAKPGILTPDCGPRCTPDRGPGLAGYRQPLPGCRRNLSLRADDLDLIAILELGDERRVPAVYATADAAVAYAGMN